MHKWKLKKIISIKLFLRSRRVPLFSFDGMGYDENDDTITQVITYVRCISNASNNNGLAEALEDINTLITSE